jgi:hypothetical protein
MTAQDLIAAVRRSAKRSGLYDSYDSDSCDFDIAAAVHTYAVLNYNGQVSDLYKVLSTSEFNPGPMWTSDQEISTNVFYDTVERIAKRRKLS